MTIQPSIVIWTLICFCLLMFILQKLLWGPMLKFMDDRQEKIDRAKEKQQAHGQRYAAEQAAQRSARSMEEKNAAHAAALAVEEARAQAQNQLAQAKRQQEEDLLAYAENLKQEHQELKMKLDQGARELAEAFSRQLVS